jgi:TolA-binding protein
MSKWPLVVITLLSLILPLFPLWAQEPSPQGEAAAVAEEINRLNDSVNEIAELMRTLLENQDLNIALKRIELQLRRMGPKMEELRKLKGNKSNREEEMVRFQGILDNFEDEIGALGMDDGEDGQEQRRRIKTNWEARIKSLKDQIWKLDQQIVELEEELEDEREQLHILETFVDERLGL